MMLMDRIGHWQRSWRFHPVPTIGLGVILCVLGIRQLGWLEIWELRAYDQLVRLFDHSEPDPRLLVVEITEADFQVQGQAPIPDDVIVEAIERLQRHRPTIIAVDLFRDLVVPRRGDSRSGRAVADALRHHPNTLAICRIGDEENPEGIPPPRDMPPDRVGYVDVVLDGDGVLRRNLLFLDPPESSVCRASASLAMLSVLHYLSRQGIAPPTRTTEGLIWGTQRLPRLRSHSGGYQRIDDAGFQMLLRYRSPDQVAERVTLTEVLSGQIESAQVRDRIVLLGVTAESAKDNFPTPYHRGTNSSRRMSGVLVHAQMISQLLGIVLDGKAPLQSWPDGAEMVWILAWGIAGGFLGYRLANPVVLVLSGLGLGLSLSSGFALAYLQGIWLPVVGPLLALGVTGLAGRLTRAYLWELLLAGRYRIIRELGSGGMGLVHLAQDVRHPHRLCVLKQLKLPSHNPKAISTYKRLFRTEGTILTMLGTHPQIPTLYAHFYFEEDHQFYLVEEYIEGHSLEHEIRPGRQIPPTQVVRLLREMLQVLEFIHAKNIVHRDIKPSNIIRRKVTAPSQHEFVLVDFGTVRQLFLLEDSSDQTMVGTYGYAPYEQMEGNSVPASDIYALGMVCIQALTGNSILDLIALLENQSLSSFGGRPVHWCHSVPVDLEPRLISVLDRMVQLELKERYQSVVEVLMDVSEVPDQPVRQTFNQTLEVQTSVTRDLRSLSERTTITHDQDTVAREEPMTLPLQTHPYAAIIFDMDGVIVLSESLHLEAGRLALERHGVETDFEAIHTQFRGRTDQDMFGHILQQFGSHSVHLQRLIHDKNEIFLARLDRVGPVPGSVEFVRQARRYCAKLGLTTSASRQEQLRIFQVFDLHPWFDVVVTADDVAKAKPDPEPYARTVMQLNCDPTHCLVIEDAIHGIQAARAAGCQVVGITTSFGRDDLLAAGAMAAVDTFAELQEYLLQVTRKLSL